jgi:PAS domain S-box-containing protein
MKDEEKTKEQLIDELQSARDHLAVLSAAEAERKRTQATLRGSEAKYRAVVEDQTEVISRFKPDGTFLFVNDVFSRFFGKPREELIDSQWFPHAHPEDIERVQARLATMTAASPVVLIENRVYSGSGELRWFQFVNRGFYDSAGHLVEIQSVGRDITERRQAEEAQQESEQAYRSLFDHSPVSIWDEDGCRIAERMNELRGQGVQDLRAYLDDNPDALMEMVERIKIIDVNECSVAMFGAKNKEDLVANLPRLFDDKPLAVLKEQLISIWAGNRTFEADLHSGTLDGRRIDVLFRSHVERGDQELDLSRVIITMMDITEHKRAEEERRKLERQLEHAQKLESLGVLAGGIAHDFNNLLTGILGGADLALCKMPPGSPGRGHVAIIRKSAVRATDLTNQMLAYSGQGHFLVEHLNLSSLVLEMEQLLESSVSKKVLLESDLPTALPAVKADATQIRQVVMNLIINASEAMGETKGIVSVRTKRVILYDPAPAIEYPPDGLPPGDYVSLEVSDTGCGMDEETQAKMFDPFSTTKFQGRGLGLAAVLGIVRGHRGAIRVSSEPDRGTTIRVLFPAAERPSLPDDETPSDGFAWRGSGTVLVVDDEEIVREVVREMLREKGFDVLTAADGHQGVELYRRHADQIAVVLLDLTMPEMSGEEALAEIRRTRPNAKVILCSGYAEEDLKRRFAGIGATEFIHKPFKLRVLVRKLRAILAR